MGSREAIMHECTKQGSCGLNCEFEATGDPILIKLADINVRRLGNIKKASINPLAINHDIIGYAKAEVEKLNLK